MERIGLCIKAGSKRLPLKALQDSREAILRALYTLRSESRDNTARAPYWFYGGVLRDCGEKLREDCEAYGVTGFRLNSNPKSTRW